MSKFPSLLTHCTPSLSSSFPDDLSPPSSSDHTSSAAGSQDFSDSKRDSMCRIQTLYNTACDTHPHTLGRLLLGPKVDIISPCSTTSASYTTYMYSIPLAMLVHVCDPEASRDLISTDSIVDDAIGRRQSELRGCIIIPDSTTGQSKRAGGGMIGRETTRDAVQKIVGYMLAWCSSGGQGAMNDRVRCELAECLREDERDFGLSVKDLVEVGRTYRVLGLDSDADRIEELCVMQHEKQHLSV